MEAIPKHCGGPIPELAGTGTETTISVLNPDKKNICTEMFHEIPVRIVKRGKDAMFPVADIASGIGYDRSVLINLMSRNKENFDEYKGYVVMTHPSGGPQEMVCLTRDGVIALVLALGLGHIKDPAKKQRIKEFRSWAVETIGKVMDGIPIQPAQPAPASLPEVMDHYMAVAARFSQVTGIPRNEVIDVAMRVVQAKTGEDLEMFRQMLIPKKPETIEIRPKALSGYDPIRDFLNCCCLPQGEVTRRDLYRVYVQWCGIHEKPIGTKKFVAAILEKGIKERKGVKDRYWVGIEIVAKFKPPGEPDRIFNHEKPFNVWFVSSLRKTPGAFTPTANLYGHYLNWCKDRLCTPMAMNEFGMNLKREGVEKDRVKLIYGYRGVELR